MVPIRALWVVSSLYNMPGAEGEGGEILHHGSYLSTLPYTKSDINNKMPICQLNEAKLTAYNLGSPCMNSTTMNTSMGY